MNLDEGTMLLNIWITICVVVLLFAANAVFLYRMDRKRREAEGSVSRSNDTKEL